MKKSPLLLIIFFVSFSYTMAQTTTIKGFVVDTTTQEKLNHATVCLLQAKDSFLYKFTRVNAEGNFNFDKVDSGKYILMISYPQYADFVEKMSIDGMKDLSLGKINMIQTAHLLQDVIVTQKIAAIRLKGDTTEFKADSFKVQPNASVEDLLKQLPGIQVDKDGKITAQGQTVKKVLVDGEEFFGDDPTLVTKNLRADMVDKVQLYDRSSDQAAFTGIDDGDKQKTINLQLKANKKNGYFGKATGGLGNDKYYIGQGMFNYFKGKRKFAAYGTFGNTGTIGLGYQDEEKYAGSSNSSITVGSGGDVSIMISGNGNDPLSGGWSGNYNGQGIPDVKSGGVHFDNKWNDDKQAINLNYKIGGMSVLGNTSSTVQNNLNNGVLYTNSASNFSNHLFRQKADGSYQFQIDSTSTLKVVLGGSLSHSSADNYYSNNSNRTLDTLVNRGTRATTSDADNKNFSGNILWQKKFKKKGRTLSWNLNEYATNSNGNGYLNSETDFYNNNSIDSTALVNQRKTNISHTNDLSSNITYTEPLNKNLNLLLSYVFDKNNSNSNLQSYNMGSDSMYSQLDSVYSNHYVYDQLSNGGGVQFNFNNKKKINFNIGTRISSVNYKQSNLFTDQSISRNFVNWNPNANLRYKIKDQEGLFLNYYGNTQQPSISQLQPVLVNNDPLNIYVGNPDLRPAFNNRFSMNFYNYKVLSQQSFYAYGSYSFTSNPIVTNVTTNAAGVNTYNYFNLKTATSNYYLSAEYSAKFKKWDLQYAFGPNVNGNKYVNFTNGIMNVTKSNSYGVYVRLAKYKEKKYDISLNGNLGYNTNSTTLQNQINNNAWSYSINPDIDIFLPAKFQVHTDGNYNWQQATQSFAARSQFIWNAWIGKKFFKKENLLLKASVNDILDQNNGFSRSANNNTISQNYYTTIRRYFMVTLVWNFSKMGPGDKK